MFCLFTPSIPRFNSGSPIAKWIVLNNQEHYSSYGIPTTPILISIPGLIIILLVVFFVKGKKKGKIKNLGDNPWNYLNLVQFIVGICIALIGAGIMFHGNIFGERNSGIATVIGIIGVSLIATSYRFRSPK